MSAGPPSTPFEYGRTHPNVSDVLHTLDTLIGSTAHEGAKRIALGLAVRPNLTEHDVERLLDFSASAWTVHEALLVNPCTASMPAVKNLFTSDMIAVFLARDDVRDHAHDILRICDQPRTWNTPTDAELRDAIRAALGTDLIEDYFARTYTTHDFAVAAANARHSMLTSGGFDAIIDLAYALDAGPEASTQRQTNAQLLFSSLCQRSDLSADQGLALVALGERLSKRERGSAHWRFSTLVGNPHAPMPAMNRLVVHRSKRVRDMVLTSPRLNQRTVHVALRSHIPYAIMKADGPIPVDAAHALLDDLEAGRARRQVLPDEEIVRYLDALLKNVADEQVWERSLALLRHRSPTAASAFFDTVWNRTPHWSERSREVTAQDLFLDWARRHADDDLRALAASRAFLPAHLHDAAHDPTGIVRAAVVTNPYASSELLAVLAEDPHEAVRAAVGERFLAAFD